MQQLASTAVLQYCQVDFPAAAVQDVHLVSAGLLLIMSHDGISCRTRGAASSLPPPLPVWARGSETVRRPHRAESTGPEDLQWGEGNLRAFSVESICSFRPLDCNLRGWFVLRSVSEIRLEASLTSQICLLLSVLCFCDCLGSYRWIDLISTSLTLLDYI